MTGHNSHPISTFIVLSDGECDQRTVIAGAVVFSSALQLRVPDVALGKVGVTMVFKLFGESVDGVEDSRVRGHEIAVRLGKRLRGEGGWSGRWTGIEVGSWDILRIRQLGG